MSEPLGDFVDWKVAAPPEPCRLRGRTVLLEPVDPDRHLPALLEAACGDPTIWTYLPHGPFERAEDFQSWLRWAAGSPEHLFFALMDTASGRAEGMASYMRPVPVHGVIEIGYIWFGAGLRRTTAATETIFLLLRHAFEDLDNRRVEWKCNALNQASRRAAERFGFTSEGVFLQHMVVKGRNRDTAWYAMLDRDWPAIRSAFEAWLSPDNFDSDGAQRQTLASIRLSTE